MAWTANVRVRLSVMMFLQYAFQGIWIIPLNNYLTKTAHYSFVEAGAIFSTVALGFIIAPFFVGMIADRFFPAQIEHDWFMIWMIPVAMAAALLVIFLLGFKDKMLVVQREGEVMEKAAIAATHDGASQTPS